MTVAIQKKIWEDNQWSSCTFYEVKETHTLIDWLKSNYGRQQYSVTWWRTVNSVWLRDKIYTHWKMCE